MLNARATILGVDKQIDYINNKLYNGLSYSNWDCFPRCYINETRSGKVAEHSLNNKEYKSVMFNDKTDITSFWIRTDSQIDEGTLIDSVSLVVSCNLVRLFPDEVERSDEMIKNAFLKILNRLPNIKISDVKYGVDGVYREFSKENLKYSDIQPRCLLRFDGEISYTIDCCC